MDPTERKITKIAREAGKFTVQAMKEEGIGTAEFDFIHLVRHHPGITQTEVREQLKIDKGAAARRAASLEAKGYLTGNRTVGRQKPASVSYGKAETLKNSKAEMKRFFMNGCFWSFRKRRQKASAKHWTSCTGNRRENGRIILRNFSKILSEKADKTIKATAEGGSSDEG